MVFSKSVYLAIVVMIIALHGDVLGQTELNADQVECYSTAKPGCSGAPDLETSGQDPRQCCHRDGFWYRLGPSGECVHCIEQIAANITVTLEYPFPVDLHGGNSVYRAASGPVTVTCTAKGPRIGPVSYQWSSTCRSCPFQSANTSTIRRAAVHSGDNGTHTCVVTITGTSASASIDFRVVDSGIQIFRGSPRGNFVNNGVVISESGSFRFRIFCRSDSMSENVGQIIGLDVTPLTNNSFFSIARRQPGEISVENRVGSQAALTSSQQGVYTCRIPLQSGELKDTNIGIYPSGFNTPPSIVALTSDSSSTLTCTSTGSPATTVSWTRNGQPLTVDDITYKMSQTVTDRASSTYENVLIIDQPFATIIGSTFTCTVANIFGSDTSDSIKIQESAPVRCFTTPSSDGELNCGSSDGEFNAASLEECCLSPNGQFFEALAGSEGCTPCIVFGWLDGTDIILEERTSSYTLQAGFIKGGAVQTFVTDQTLASFQIAIEEGNARQGVNLDFVVPYTAHSLIRQDPYSFNVPVTIRVDSIALEPEEEFTLSLVPTNPAAMKILTGGTSGLIAIPEIRVVIRDLESPCPDPPNIVNGMVTFTGNSVDDIAIYICNSGFELIGSTPTTCTQVGENPAAFSPAPPVCRPLCPDSAGIANGMVTSTGNSVGDTATYTCNSGFELIGSATTTCTQVDVNSTDFLPVAPECRQPLTVVISVIYDYFTGGRIGYRAASGPVTVTCIAIGPRIGPVSYQWSSTCRSCPFQSATTSTVKRAAVHSGDNGIHTCVVTINGISASASIDFRVVDSGIHIFRGSPRGNFVNNGVVVSESGSFRFRFFCRSDSMSENVGQIIGLDGIPLTNNNFFSIARRQPGEISVENRVGSQDALTSSQQGVYTCHIPLQSGELKDTNIGIYPSGFNTPTRIVLLTSESSDSSSTLTCTSTGSPATNVSWTRNGQPLIIDGNTYKMSQTVTGRASSTYENVLIIDQPFATIIGNTFTCTVANMFGTSALNIQVTAPCPDPADIANGRVTFTGNSVGDTATYTCNSGFELIGSVTSKCAQVDGNSSAFSPAPPVCRPLCSDPVGIANGMVTFTGNSVGDTATYTCNLGFELIGSVTIMCTQVNGKSAAFSPAPPVCIPLCPDPAHIANGMVTFTGNSVGDTATYTCNSGFELIGSTTVTCTQVNRNFAVFSLAPPVCRPLCPEPTNIANGMVTFTGNSVGDTATYTCNSGFKLIATCTQVDVSSAAFSPAAPMCRNLVGIEQKTYTASEADGSVEVCAILVRGIHIGPTQVTLTTFDGGAAASKDYTSKIEELVFDSVTTRSCIVIPIINDVVPEIAEDFIVRLTVDHTHADTATEVATITITDNDEPEELCNTEVLVLTATQERNRKAIVENIVTVFPNIFAASNGTEPTSKEELFASVYSSLAEGLGRVKSSTGYNEFVEAVTEITEAHQEACSGPPDERLSLEDVPELSQQFATLPLTEVQELQRIFGKMLCINSYGPSAGRKRKKKDTHCLVTCPCPLEDFVKVDCPCGFFACLLKYFNTARGKSVFGFSTFDDDGFRCLGFVLDTSGSMTNELEAVKKLTSFFVAKEQDEPACYVITPFNNFGPLPIRGRDYGPAEVFDTFEAVDLRKMRDSISALRANGGGSGCGEYAFRGINETLFTTFYGINTMGDGSQMIVITDELAQEPHLADSIIAEARRRRVCIHFILSELLCGQNYSIFEKVANETGGRVLVPGSPDEFNKFLEIFAKFSLSYQGSPNCTEFYRNSSVVRKKRRAFTRRCHIFRVSTFTNILKFLITTGQSQATVCKPSGESVNIDIVGGYGSYREMGPQPGEWSVCVASGTLTVSFNNRVLLDLVVTFVKEDESSPGQLMTTSVPPPACSTGIVAVVTSRVPDISSAHLNYIRDGHLVGHASLTLCGGAMVGNATFPLGSVTYQLQGEDVGGNPFQISWKTVKVKPGKYLLTALSDPVEVNPGDSTVFIFKLYNQNSYGSTNFTLTTESTSDVRAILQQTHISLNAAESAEISARVITGSSPGDNSVTVVASDGCTRTSASQTVSIKTPELPTAAPDVCGCENGGTCVIIIRPRRVIKACQCPSGFGGRLCEIVYN